MEGGETIVDSLVRKLRRMSSSSENLKIGENAHEVFLILVRKI